MCGIKWKSGLSRKATRLDYETLWLKESAAGNQPVQRDLFPAPQPESPSLSSKSQKGQKSALSKKPGGMTIITRKAVIPTRLRSS